MRFLSAALAMQQSWETIDFDVGLLTRGAERLLAQPGFEHRAANDLAEFEVTNQQRAFRCLFRQANLMDLDQLNLTCADLVTASALLDLVSQTWLEKLVTGCAASQAIGFFTLNYDGHFSLTPEHATDAEVIAAINQHQLTDKGLGAALGPGSWREAKRLFEREAFLVATGPSIWRLDSSDLALQLALLSGWANAASEQAPAHRTAIDKWLNQRREQAANGQLHITVGHQDILAIPN